MITRRNFLSKAGLGLTGLLIVPKIPALRLPFVPRDSADLQHYLDVAKPGDSILLPEGVVFRGPFTISSTKGTHQILKGYSIEQWKTGPHFIRKIGPDPAVPTGKLYKEGETWWFLTGTRIQNLPAESQLAGFSSLQNKSTRWYWD